MRQKARREFLHMRLSDDEAATLNKLADLYEVNRSTFIRLMIGYINEERPKIIIVPRRNGDSNK